MKTFTTRKSLQEYLQQIKALNQTIGFVPTMGALHRGHLSLIELAQQQNNVTLCSIFVNPSQFNDPNDLEKYPRTIEADTQLLEQVNCDILFSPGVNEMYDGNEQWHLNIGETEHLLEGEFRPGHYQGVTQVVNKFFNIITPDTAYFGQKDYQQFLIISKMVTILHMPVKLVMCPIMREADGLAMSSRNIHLTAADRQHGLVLSKTLNWLGNNFDKKNIPALKKEAAQMINAEPGVELDYFEIADADTLHQANEASAGIVALVAAKVGHTRLIDNIVIS
ncbi:pantoate--beta-alanine ligase [Mucilaginibacter xinganensis]|uniref:Pantothenate synthetase n=1 Tax=Mucilaginibacter xinganensis TaxID=1234841 RepID=A0A223NS16_9SPHI|nr:pantoate--beta-alanine ligase [Mucilaginibacter xinganensis]